MNIPHIPEGSDEFRAAHGIEVRDDGNTLVGYAAVFDSDTFIDSYEGRFVERIAKGAFKRTLKNRGDRIKVLFNHGNDPSIGNMPLGKPSVIREDNVGLWVEVPLADTDYNRERIKPLLKNGALDGMSFRFAVPAGGDEWDDSGDVPVRTVREAKLFEFGPVTFPAYAAATASLRADPRFVEFVRSTFTDDADTVAATSTIDFESTPDDSTVTDPVSVTERNEAADPVSAPGDSQKHSPDTQARIERIVTQDEWRQRLIEKVTNYGKGR